MSKQKPINPVNNPDQPVRCQQCQTLVTKATFNQHILSTHTKPQEALGKNVTPRPDYLITQCEICGVQVTKKRLLKHMKKVHQVSIGDKGSSALKDRLDTVHSQNGRVGNGTSSRSLSEQSEDEIPVVEVKRRVHKTQTAGVTRLSKCPHCGKWVYPQNLKDHISNHHPKTEQEEKNNSRSRRSIIDHTTTCPHCDHRVLHKNLEDHIQRIHPDQIGNGQFARSLKRTATEEWWDEAKKLKDVVPLSEIFSDVVDEPDPKRITRKNNNSLSCPICRSNIGYRKLLSHMTDFHKARYSATTGAIEPMDPHLGIQNVPEPQKTKMHNQSTCTICGILILIIDMERHQAKHVFDQPLLDPEQVHCPICKLNIRHRYLRKHLEVIHPEIPAQQRGEIALEVRDNQLYGMDEIRIVQTVAGRTEVGRRNWAKCPHCGMIMKLGAIEKHYTKNHLTIR